jgi:hypothetical protein
MENMNFMVFPQEEQKRETFSGASFTALFITALNPSTM